MPDWIRSLFTSGKKDEAQTFRLLPPSSQFIFGSSQPALRWWEGKDADGIIPARRTDLFRHDQRKQNSEPRHREKREICLWRLFSNEDGPVSSSTFLCCYISLFFPLKKSVCIAELFFFSSQSYCISLSHTLKQRKERQSRGQTKTGQNCGNNVAPEFRIRMREEDGKRLHVYSFSLWVFFFLLPYA